TWSKLDEIERWLDGPGPEQYPESVPTAELELAEGRLALTKKEASGLAKPVLASRLASAESGFKGLLAHPPVKPEIRERAERGLDEIDALRGTKAVAAVPAPAPAPTVAANSNPGGLAIQPRAAWNAAAAVLPRLTPASGWTRITIHHSAKYSKDI